jgi:GTPase SAR1 family protein
MPDNILTARYRKTGVTHYDGNPFIEALPPLQSSLDEARNMRGSLSFEKNMVFESAVNRAHNLIRIVDGFFQPLSSHMHLSEKISLMIRAGYVARNPRTGDLQRHLQNGYERLQSGDLDAFRFEDSKSSAQSMTLIGCSGSGKTTSLKRILAGYPQAIYHPEFNINQVVHLKIDCSHNGSLKEICINFFRGLDRVLGTNYEDQYGSSRNGIETMLAKMSQSANSHALGVLVIDEIQHLSRSRSGGSEEMLNFFVTLVNTIGVPVILIGTPKARSIFEKDLRSARRGAGFGAIFWNPIPEQVDGKPNQEWVSFTNKLWELQLLQNQDQLLTESLRDVWHELSQGVMDIVVKLFVLAQLRAIAVERETITEGLLRQVYEDELKPVHPMLEALRSGKPDKIAQYSDLVVPHMDKRMIQWQDKIAISNSQSEHEKILASLPNENAKRLFMMLKDVYPLSLLAKTIKQVSDDYPGLEFQEMFPLVVPLIQQDSSRSNPSQEAVKAICFDSNSATKKSKNAAKAKVLKLADWKLLDTEDIRYRFYKANQGQSFYEALDDADILLDSEMISSAQG